MGSAMTFLCSLQSRYVDLVFLCCVGAAVVSFAAIPRQLYLTHEDMYENADAVFIGVLVGSEPTGKKEYFQCGSKQRSRFRKMKSNFHVLVELKGVKPYSEVIVQHIEWEPREPDEPLIDGPDPMRMHMHDMHLLFLRREQDDYWPLMYPFHASKCVIPLLPNEGIGVTQKAPINTGRK